MHFAKELTSSAFAPNFRKMIYSVSHDYRVTNTRVLKRLCHRENAILVVGEIAIRGISLSHMPKITCPIRTIIQPIKGIKF
jgi:hypothetical protein